MKIVISWKNNCMFLLLLISSTCFMISFICHLLLMFNINIPSDEILVGLNTTLVISVIARIHLTKYLRQRNKWFWNNCIKNVAPHWIKVWTSIFFVYGICIAIVNLAGMFLRISPSMTEIDSVIASKRLFIGVFSLLLAIYSFELFLNLSYTILDKKTKQQNDEEICLR